MRKDIGVLALQGDFEAHGKALVRLGFEAREVRLPSELEGLRGLIVPGGESTTLLRLMREYGFDEAIPRFAASGGALFGTCAGAILFARGVSSPAQWSLGLLDIDIERNGFGRQIDSFETRLTDVAPEILETPAFSRADGEPLQEDALIRAAGASCGPDALAQAPQSLSSRPMAAVGPRPQSRVEEFEAPPLQAARVGRGGRRPHRARETPPLLPRKRRCEAGWAARADEGSSAPATEPGDPASLRAVFIRAPRIRRVGPQAAVLASFEGEPVLVRQGRLLAATFHPELTPDPRVHSYFLRLLPR